MSVSATEVAKAAVEFWRQGLGEDETEKRLKASIQYAKISAMEFDEAAELITAATNTMEVSAQHVADIFAYMGDASASGADEIGIAMQKASASAVEFGLSFEWLGAYIATISEKTRQAPEVIGTSLNSIMARLHSIKARRRDRGSHERRCDWRDHRGGCGADHRDYHDRRRGGQRTGN